jgi:hypothetical protein
MVAEWLRRREFAEREWKADREGYLHARAMKAMLLTMRAGGDLPDEDLPVLAGHDFTWDDGRSAMVLEIEPGQRASMGEAYVVGVFFGGDQPARYLLVEEGSGRKILTGRTAEGSHINYGEWAGGWTAGEFAAAVHKERLPAMDREEASGPGRVGG